MHPEQETVTQERGRGGGAGRGAGGAGGGGGRGGAGQAASAALRGETWRKASDLLWNYGIVLALVVLAVALSFLSPYFLTWQNIINVVRQVSINGILAVGMTFVIITAGIDLSVGSILGLTGAVAAGVSLSAGVPAGILAALLVGAALGLISGLSFTNFRVPPFIATLAMLTIARGATLIYTGGRPISGLPESILFLGGGYLGPIPVPVILMLLLYAVGHVVLTRTTFGRYLYAIGGNVQAAELSGIPVKRYLTAVYVISGLTAAVAGVVMTGRLASADPQAGFTYELDAIAAVVLGGTNLAGGQGSVIGTLVGALTLGVLSNGLNLLGVPSFWQQVAKGLVILLAVVLSNAKRRA